VKTGWSRSTIADVAVVHSGSGFPKKHQGSANGDIPFYKVSDMSLPGNEREMFFANNTISEDVRAHLGASIFPPGSTIFPKIGGAIATNKKRQTTRASCVDNNVMGVVPKADRLLSDFLYYFFLAHDLSEFANEAHLPSIRKTVVEGWALDLPDSLAEQRRIVSILDEAFEGIATAKANAEKNLSNAAALFESQLDAAFAEHHANGVSKPLVHLCDPTRAITYGVIKLGAEVANGVPCLRSSNVRRLRIDTSVVRRIEQSLSQSYSRTVIKGGEVLVNVRGTLGGIAVAAPQMIGWNISREVAIVPVDPSLMGSHYCAYWIAGRASQRWLGGVKKGATYIGINLEDLRLLPVEAPSLERQMELVRRLDCMRQDALQLESIHRRSLAALDELKKALLHQAFSGQLPSEIRAG
jgi:type I restriction enzyme, S subunit